MVFVCVYLGVCQEWCIGMFIWVFDRTGVLVCLCGCLTEIVYWCAYLGV